MYVTGRSDPSRRFNGVKLNKELNVAQLNFNDLHEDLYKHKAGSDT